MSPATAQIIRRWIVIGIALILFGCLLTLFLLTSDALQNSLHFAYLYALLLAVNVLALIALLTLIGMNLKTLTQQVLRGRAGARLTFRLVSLMVILSIIPVTILYYFSLQFIHQRLESWFDVNVEQALTHALDLSRANLDSRLREVLKQSETIAEEIAVTDDAAIVTQLNEMRNRSGASELSVLASNGQIIAFNSADAGQLLPSRPNDGILLQLKQSDQHISLKPIANKGLHIRVLIKLPKSNHNVRLLYALFPLAERIGQLASSVEAAYGDYKERTFLHPYLKLSFTLILSLVLLLSIFSSVWVAFFAARRLVAPLSILAEGTHAVANGDYSKQLPVTHFDELGFLVHSFNQMTRRIAQAQKEVKYSQQLADSQRDYLEAVLGRLSSGVISLDPVQRLRTANAAAIQILGLPLSELVEKTLVALQAEQPTLEPLYTAIHTHILGQAQDWREEIVLFGASGRKVLMCRGTQLQLHEEETQTGGYVVVFDDITTLVQAQRDAAWSEVARRLAHEIKNPLTPIKLSAERLRHKYLRTLPEKESETLDRMTHTIIQQVEAMKEMVNAFSDYARNPVMQWQSLNINHLITEVVDLYHHEQTAITTLFDDNIPAIEADKGRLRQVLHNLIKNALEASPPESCVTITTRYLTEVTFNCVELRIQDQGMGVPVEMLDQVFEPYVTTKLKGTGLGLAIVKKIIEEHGGMVWMENTPGACVIIRLPIRPVDTGHWPVN